MADNRKRSIANIVSKPQDYAIRGNNNDKNKIQNTQNLMTSSLVRRRQQKPILQEKSNKELSRPHNRNYISNHESIPQRNNQFLHNNNGTALHRQDANQGRLVNLNPNISNNNYLYQNKADNRFIQQNRIRNESNNIGKQIMYSNNGAIQNSANRFMATRQNYFQNNTNNSNNNFSNEQKVVDNFNNNQNNKSNIPPTNVPINNQLNHEGVLSTYLNHQDQLDLKISVENFNRTTQEMVQLLHEKLRLKKLKNKQKLQPNRIIYQLGNNSRQNFQGIWKKQQDKLEQYWKEEQQKQAEKQKVRFRIVKPLSKSKRYQQVSTKSINQQLKNHFSLQDRSRWPWNQDYNDNAQCFKTKKNRKHEMDLMYSEYEEVTPFPETYTHKYKVYFAYNQDLKWEEMMYGPFSTDKYKFYKQCKAWSVYQGEIQVLKNSRGDMKIEAVKLDLQKTHNILFHDPQIEILEAVYYETTRNYFERLVDRIKSNFKQINDKNQPKLYTFEIIDYKINLPFGYKLISPQFIPGFTINLGDLIIENQYGKVQWDIEDRYEIGFRFIDFGNGFEIGENKVVIEIEKLKVGSIIIEFYQIPKRYDEYVQKIDKNGELKVIKKLTKLALRNQSQFIKYNPENNHWIVKGAFKEQQTKSQLEI